MSKDGASRYAYILPRRMERVCRVGEGGGEREGEGGREGGRIHALTAYARTRTFARMRSHVREPYTCYTCACTHSSA